MPDTDKGLRDMKKTDCLILCLLLLCNISGAIRIPSNVTIHAGKIDYESIADVTDPACADCGNRYLRTGKTVEIYTESGHHKGTYSVWLNNGDRYIKFNNEWIRIEGKSRFFYHGNAYVIKKSS